MAGLRPWLVASHRPRPARAAPISCEGEGGPCPGLEGLALALVLILDSWFLILFQNYSKEQICSREQKNRIQHCLASYPTAPKYSDSYFCNIVELGNLRDTIIGNFCFKIRSFWGPKIFSLLISIPLCSVLSKVFHHLRAKVAGTRWKSS